MALWTPNNLGARCLCVFRGDLASGSDGVAITGWTDLGPNAIAASSSAWPVYRANALNGRPVLDFAGHKHVLLATTVAGAVGLHAWVVFLHQTADDWEDNARILSVNRDGADDFNTTTTSALLLRLGTLTDNSLDNFYNSAGTQIAANVAIDTWAIGRASLVGTAFSGAVNGGTPATATYTAPTWDILHTHIGADKVFAGTLADFFDGRVAAVVMATGTLTALEIEKVDGYLAHWCGLQGNLPSNHTYKLAPPRTGPKAPMQRMIRSPMRRVMQRSAEAN